MFSGYLGSLPFLVLMPVRPSAIPVRREEEGGSCSGGGFAAARTTLLNLSRRSLWVRQALNTMQGDYRLSWRESKMEWMEMKQMSAVKAAEPAWEIGYLLPRQGTWSEEEYLSLETNHLVEFPHGYIEVLPMPTEAHQLIVLYLYRTLLAFVESRALGWCWSRPYQCSYGPANIRNPMWS